MSEARKSIMEKDIKALMDIEIIRETIQNGKVQTSKIKFSKLVDGLESTLKCVNNMPVNKHTMQCARLISAGSYNVGYISGPTGAVLMNQYKEVVKEKEAYVKRMEGNSKF
jgi:hypothetical protein